MMKLLRSLFYNPNDVENLSIASFQTYTGIDLPDNGTGQNGDEFIRYHNGPEHRYKKVAGVWTLLEISSNAYVNGKADYEEAVPDTTIAKATFDLSGFYDFADEKMEVYYNGQRLIEKPTLVGANDHDWVRDSGANTITFKTNREADTSLVVKRWTALAEEDDDFIEVFTAGEALTADDICYRKLADNKLYKAQADVTTNCPGELYLAKETVASDSTLQVYKTGATIPATGVDTSERSRFLSEITAGANTNIAPSTAGNVVISVLYPISTTAYLFKPNRLIVL